MEALRAIPLILQSLKGSIVPIAVPLIYLNSSKIIAFIRRTNKTQKERTHYEISYLGYLALIALIATSVLQVVYPLFTQELNVFKVTGSRLQTEVSVIKQRLLKYEGSSTSQGFSDTGNERMINLLSSGAGKLLYIKYGTDTFQNCIFCQSMVPQTFLLYALPKILAPYLINWFVLGMSTSSAVSPGAIQWRSWATFTHLALAIIDIARVFSYEDKSALNMSINSIVWFHWRMRLERGVILLLANIVFAGILYVTMRGLFFTKPLDDFHRGSRVAKLSDNLKEILLRARGNSIMKLSIHQDEYLRNSFLSYWQNRMDQDGRFWSQESVIEARQNAVERLGGKNGIDRIKLETRMLINQSLKY
ncbi:hypothetical protein NADFUDRAFT_79578 [Nadsonia fulvescens var. elongata DSM 6958]|uniref:Uncharacterized protein n=1 Tax=Nadsonia fulvescens var. elongata DSM 6958 TaxID=857566 RepID=A0A1E3PHB5_9ASCO|nr:hypothetical protein NADFUDRAFT_79578 [Nadsonia fulvescens var. elongata DSM 6958]